MYNPRFPHKLYIKRVSKDSLGNVIYDEEGNVQYESVVVNKVEMFNGSPCCDSDGNLQTLQSPYIEFGYRTETQSTKTEGDVVVNHTKLSTPMFTNTLSFGNIVEITDYERTYKATVIVKKTFNWGSYIYINEIHN